LPETHSYHLSKVLNAPLKFVYEWCTDYREDDNQITGSRTQRKVLQKTKRRVIYLSAYERDGEMITGVNIVTLQPPKGWSLEYLGEEEDATGKYTLTRLGPSKTRLDMIFTDKYKISDAPTKEEDENHTDQIWDKYIARLETDYSSSA
jgi:hypothetical protein